MKKKESDQNLPLPGELLRKAREQKDISAEVVAQRLRLDVERVTALENDDYAIFPADAYVRGHLRGYANLVDLDPGQLIIYFDKRSGAVPPLEPHVSHPEQQVGSGDKHIRVVTWSLIVALALMLGLWWQTHRSGEPADQESGQPELLVEDVDHDSDQLEMMHGTTGALSLSEVPGEATVAPEEPEELKHDYGVVQMSELPEPQEPIEQTEILSSTPGTGQSTDVASQNNIQPASAVESTVDQNQIISQDIVLQFTDDSWIQITDATGKKRFSRLGKADEVVSVTGVAPFSIVIGRASVVIISYQGNFIDLEPLAKDEVARFNLDETGAYK